MLSRWIHRFVNCCCIKTAYVASAYEVYLAEYREGVVVALGRGWCVSIAIYSKVAKV